MRESHKKPIIVEVSNPDDFKQPNFDQVGFERAVGSKGYEIHLEKALRCPCSVKGAGNPLSNCLNCGGFAWIYIQKKKTLSVVQSINRSTKYKNWTENDRGTISVTLFGEDRIAFMDRITVMQIESIFTEILRFKVVSGKFFSFTFYNPIQIHEIFIFVSPDKKLIPLKEDIDYAVVDNRIDIINNSLKSYLNEEKELTCTVRYLHNPTYNVIDIDREVVEQISTDKGIDCDTLQRKLYPIHCMARKSHFMFDNPNLIGESLFDNTIL